MAGASTILGFAPNWLSQIINRRAKALKTLQGLGFTASRFEGSVLNARGATTASTISLDDFALLIIYATIQKKKEAIALQACLTKMSLNDFFRHTFGYRPLSIEEKRRIFYQDYAARLNWLEEDTNDWFLIAQQEAFLAGHTEQE
jgi:hypothetical protein